MGHAQSNIDQIDNDTIANAYSDFIDHNVNPSSINSIIEFTNFKNFDNMTEYYMEHCEPTLQPYIITNDIFYSFPKFMREIVNYETLCILGLLNWLKFYHEILESDDREYYIKDASIDNRDIYREMFNTPIDNSVYNYLIMYDHFDCLKFVIQKGCIINEEMLILSIKHGHLRIFKYLWRKLRITFDILYMCILYEQYDMMVILLDNGRMINVSSCNELPKCKEYMLKYCNGPIKNRMKHRILRSMKCFDESS